MGALQRGGRGEPERVDPRARRRPRRSARVGPDNRMVGPAVPEVHELEQRRRHGARRSSSARSRRRRALGVARGPLGVPALGHRLPRAPVRQQPLVVRPRRRRSSWAAASRSSWPASTHRRHRRRRPVLVLPGGRAARRAEPRPRHRTPAHPHRRPAVRRRAVEQLRDARDRHDDGRPARAARRSAGWCGPTAATPPSTRSACTAPRRRPTAFRHGYPQDEIDAMPRRELAEPADAAGPATIEAYTVMHSRDGAPETAIAACLLADGRRAWGTSTDAGRRGGDVRGRVGRSRGAPRRRGPVAPLNRGAGDILFAMAAPDRLPIVLDCDPGHDDAVAIDRRRPPHRPARHHHGRRQRTARSAPPTTPSSSATCWASTCRCTPARRGRWSPNRSTPTTSTARAGSTAPICPNPSRPPDGTDAVGFIVETCRGAARACGSCRRAR